MVPQGQASMTHLHIKNMVCSRCIEAVEEEFRKAEVSVQSVHLGEVLLEKELDSQQKIIIKDRLAARGFELLEDKSSQLIEQIKKAIIGIIHQRDRHPEINNSTYLERQLGKDYKTLSQLFSSVEGITIERYMILQKVERAKELLIYDELNSSQIAYELGYSSVQHLSSQFKKVTGMSPTEFKKLRKPHRKSLDKLAG